MMVKSMQMNEIHCTNYRFHYALNIQVFTRNSCWWRIQCRTTGLGRPSLSIALQVSIVNLPNQPCFSLAHVFSVVSNADCVTKVFFHFSENVSTYIAKIVVALCLLQTDVNFSVNSVSQNLAQNCERTTATAKCLTHTKSMIFSSNARENHINYSAFSVSWKTILLSVFSILWATVFVERS